jgi:glutathione S-transferase
MYDFTLAPSPRRVRIFLAEKGIELELVQVDIMHNANRTPEFYKKNPLGSLPILEFDDGSCLSESVAICRYFEEIQPEPPLFGVGAREKAIVEMWNRRIELEIFAPVGHAWSHLSKVSKADHGYERLARFRSEPRSNASRGWIRSLRIANSSQATDIPSRTSRRYA